MDMENLPSPEEIERLREEKRQHRLDEERAKTEVFERQRRAREEWAKTGKRPNEAEARKQNLEVWNMDDADTFEDFYEDWLIAGKPGPNCRNPATHGQPVHPPCGFY